jgi:protein TonB
VLSGVAHAVVGVFLTLVPLFAPASPPRPPDYIRALLYDPPPPPPPPLPKGSPLVAERPRPKARAPLRLAESDRPTPVLEAPIQAAVPVPEPDPATPETQAEPYGSSGGSDSGVPGGMEGGVEGGMVGGVPGGVLGGVIGGTGQGPVLDYDRPPRVLKQTKPRYPQEAFVKKVEGTVLVEFVIDAGGRVVGARILQSIPQLDAAALEAVREWIFTPAFKHGQPVATVARAPVAFRIY